MRPRLAQLHQSGATDRQAAGWDAASGLWLPQTYLSEVQDEGVALTRRAKLNFVGAGVTATDDAANGRTLVTIPGGSGSAHTIMDEGVALTARTNLDFVGAGVAATDDAVNNKTIVTISGGTGVVMKDIRYADPAGSPHAQSDEFEAAIMSGSWVAVDAAGGTGRRAWTQGGGKLSLLLNGGDAASEMHALMKPYALAVGEALQTYVSTVGYPDNYSFGGLCVADGTTYGSGNQEVFHLWNYAAQGRNLHGCNWSGYNNRTTINDYIGYTIPLQLHLRLIRQTSTTWRNQVSSDGTSWMTIGADKTLSFTPSHVGFSAGTWGSAQQKVFSFDYFRVV